MSRLLTIYTADDVWEATENGLTVFQEEIEDFSLSRNVKNPYIDERNPSCRIKQSRKSGLYLLNIYNGEGGYDTAISFIQKKYGLDYNQAIEYILTNEKLTPKEIKTIKKPKLSSVNYDFEPIKFTKEHKDYYCIGGITEEFLNKEMDIYAVGKWAINKNIKEPVKGEIKFAYEFKDIHGNLTNKLKLLTIGCKKEDKWRNNCDPTNFFYTYKIKDGDLVFISKSNKDACITKLCGITTIAVLSENYANIAEGLKKLLPLFPNSTFCLNLGSDPQGFDTSFKLSKEFNLCWFNIPRKYLKNGVNDNFEFVKYFGIEEFKKLLKKKNYI